MKHKIDKFEDYLFELELSQNTIDAYMLSIRQFFDRFDDFNKKNIIAFKNYLLDERGLKPKTVNIRLNGLNQYARFLGKLDLQVKTIKVPKQTKTDNAITVREYNKLLKCIQEDKRLIEREKWLMIVKTLAMTGARINEFLRFQKKHIIKGVAELPTKGKYRRIYFPKKLQIELLEYCKEMSYEDFVFLSKYGTPITSRGVSQMLRNLGKRYDIREEVMHPHAFRHLFAIEFLKRNKNIALLADLMGHDNIATTAIYLQLSEKEQRRQLDKAVDW